MSLWRTARNFAIAAIASGIAIGLTGSVDNRGGSTSLGQFLIFSALLCALAAIAFALTAVVAAVRKDPLR